MSNIVLASHYQKYKHLDLNVKKKSKGLINFINGTKLSYDLPKDKKDNLMKIFTELSDC